MLHTLIARIPFSEICAIALILSFVCVCARSPSYQFGCDFWNTKQCDFCYALLLIFPRVSTQQVKYAKPTGRIETERCLQFLVSLSDQPIALRSKMICVLERASRPILFFLAVFPLQKWIAQRQRVDFYHIRLVSQFCICCCSCSMCANRVCSSSVSAITFAQSIIGLVLSTNTITFDHANWSR